jgi:hypothetical protein
MDTGGSARATGWLGRARLSQSSGASSSPDNLTSDSPPRSRGPAAVLRAQCPMGSRDTHCENSFVLEHGFEPARFQRFSVRR